MLTEEQKTQLMKDVTRKVLEVARTKKMDKYEVEHLKNQEIKKWLKEHGIEQ